MMRKKRVMVVYDLNGEEDNSKTLSKTVLDTHTYRLFFFIFDSSDESRVIKDWEHINYRNHTELKNCAEMGYTKDETKAYYNAAGLYAATGVLAHATLFIDASSTEDYTLAHGMVEEALREQIPVGPGNKLDCRYIAIPRNKMMSNPYLSYTALDVPKNFIWTDYEDDEIRKGDKKCVTKKKKKTKKKTETSKKSSTD